MEKKSWDDSELYRICGTYAFKVRQLRRTTTTMAIMAANELTDSFSVPNAEVLKVKYRKSCVNNDEHILNFDRWAMRSARLGMRFACDRKLNVCWRRQLIRTQDTGHGKNRMSRMGHGMEWIRYVRRRSSIRWVCGFGEYDTMSEGERESEQVGSMNLTRIKFFAYLVAFEP